MYNELVRQRFQNPKNAGMVVNADAVGQAGGVQFGGLIKLYWRVEKGQIVDAKFKTSGGVATIAACDVVCDWLKGKTIETASKINADLILHLLQDLPEESLLAVTLAQDATTAAVTDYFKRQEREQRKKK